MIGLEDRTVLAQDIDTAHRAGARLERACAEAGITVRTLQRWKAHGGLVAGDRRPGAHRPVPAHALSAEERPALLRPPDLGAMSAVGEHHHLRGATAGLAHPLLVGQADLDPQPQRPGVVGEREIGLVLGRQAAAEAQRLVGEQHEREQPQHHPLVGLRRMTGQGQGVVGIAAPIDVGDRELGLVNGGTQRHGRIVGARRPPPVSWQDPRPAAACFQGPAQRMETTR